MSTRRALLGAGLVAGLLTVRAGAQEPPKVKKVEGHLAPVTVEVTFRKPESPKKVGLLTGTARLGSGDLYLTHWLKYNADGKGGGLAWLDTLAGIAETSDEGATLTFKDGSTRAVRFGDDGHRYLLFRTPDGARETIDLEQVERVRFLAPARRDSDQNAMFDHWRYSPFTGEKLPPVKPSDVTVSSARSGR